MITTLLKAHLVRLKPKNFFYRNYKKFNEANFLNDVKNAKFVCGVDKLRNSCSSFLFHYKQACAFKTKTCTWE